MNLTQQTNVPTTSASFQYQGSRSSGVSRTTTQPPYTHGSMKVLNGSSFFMTIGV